MTLQLRSRDGHSFRAFSCGPASAQRGLIVVQEIFGVNRHIRAVCQGWADQGYQVLSPALFDRIRREGEYGIELGYEADDIKQGQALAREVGYFEHPLLEIEACLQAFPQGIPVGLVGYCWGGTLAWLSACRLHPADAQGNLRACVGYYGGMIAKLLQDPPDVPVMLHFGQHDPHIPLSEVEKIQAAYPDIPIFTYDAGHGFNCEARKDYDASAAISARQRTADFLTQNL